MKPLKKKATKADSSKDERNYSTSDEEYETPPAARQHSKKADENEELTNKTVKQLKELAKQRGLKQYSKLKKSELIELLSANM